MHVHVCILYIVFSVLAKNQAFVFVRMHAKYVYFSYKLHVHYVMLSSEDYEVGVACT